MIAKKVLIATTLLIFIIFLIILYNNNTNKQMINDTIQNDTSQISHYSNYDYSHTYALNDTQKKNAEIIAINETPYLLSHVGRYLRFDNRLSVGNISVDKVYEMAPGIYRSRYLPVVVLIAGNESQSGLNLHVYVDLEKKRVAYLGFTSRNVPGDTEHYYEQYSIPEGMGIRETVIVEGYPITSYYSNITVVDSPYEHGMTEEDKSKVISIAEQDERVKQFFKNVTERGETYRPSVWIYNEVGSDKNVYIQAKPIVDFKPCGSDYGRVLTVRFNAMGDNIISVEEYDTSPPI